MKKWLTPKRILVVILGFFAWLTVSVILISGALLYLLYRGMLQ